MWAEFEEKEYENPLNVQLLGGSLNLWSPGQVFERHFGFDAALLARGSFFRDLLGSMEPPSGVLFDSFDWGFVWKSLGYRRELPSFRVNLFVQAKRPEFVSRSSSKLRAHGMYGPHWRFEVTPHQQQILEKVESAVGIAAIVTYSCGAFHTLSDLYGHVAAGRLVENSTFVRPQTLVGHERWMYTGPGASGVANPDPERFEGAPLVERLRSARFEMASIQSDGPSASRSLEHVSSIVERICEAESLSNPVAAELVRRTRGITQVVAPLIDRFPEIRSFGILSQWCSLLGLRWYVAA